MIAMAVVACGSRQVSFIRQRFPMDAFFILCDLVDRNFVRSHGGLIRMARPTGLSHLKRMDFRPRIERRLDSMSRMAASAGGHFGISKLLETLAMDRSVVLRNLIYSERGVVTLHKLRIGVAATTNRRDLTMIRLADIAFGGVHGRHTRIR